MADNLYPVSKSDIKKLTGKKTKAKKFRGVTSKGEEAAVYDVKKQKVIRIMLLIDT